MSITTNYIISTKQLDIINIITCDVKDVGDFLHSVNRNRHCKMSALPLLAATESAVSPSGLYTCQHNDNNCNFS